MRPKSAAEAVVGTLEQVECSAAMVEAGPDIPADTRAAGSRKADSFVADNRMLETLAGGGPTAGHPAVAAGTVALAAAMTAVSAGTSIGQLPAKEAGRSAAAVVLRRSVHC